MLSSCALLNTLVGGLSLYTTLWTHCRPWPTSQLHQGNEMSMRMKARSRAPYWDGWWVCGTRWIAIRDGKRQMALNLPFGGRDACGSWGGKGGGKNALISARWCAFAGFSQGAGRVQSPPARIRVGWEERTRELRTVDRRQDVTGCRELRGFCDPTWHEGMSIGVNLAVGVGHLGADQTPTGSTGGAKGS